jgi:hypothetical protein
MILITLGIVKVFGCRPMMTVPRMPWAGVRKPPREEIAGDVAHGRVSRAKFRRAEGAPLPPSGAPSTFSGGRQRRYIPGRELL